MNLLELYIPIGMPHMVPITSTPKEEYLCGTVG